MDFLQPWIPHLAALGSLIAGIALTWFLCRTKTTTLRALYEERCKASKKAIVDLEAGCANLEAEVQQLRHTEAISLKRQSQLEMMVHTQQRAVEEKEQLLREAEHRMSQNFKALTAEALKATQEEFLHQARATFSSQQQEATSELEQRRVAVETLVKPVAATLNKVESKIGELERARHASEATLSEQVRQMASAQVGLQKETASLAKALRQPAGTGRGRWGEMRLLRVVELAGMQEYCDFVTPSDAERDNESGPQRPDLVVKLPTGRLIAVDSHAPLEAYLAATEAVDESKQAEELKRHANLVADHLAELASPAYREQFWKAPEFIVLFLPSEAIFSAILAEDPSLLERGIEKGVILATPTTLVALLRAAASGWRQEGLAERARNISEVGRELHSRVSALIGHVAEMGQSLDATVKNYNSAIGALERSVLPGAQQLSELGATPQEEALPALPEVDRAVLQPQTNLSSLPLSDDMNSMAATGEVPDAAFEGFTDPAPARRAKVKIKAKTKAAPSAGPEPPDADAAAGDLRAALEPQKKAG